MSESRDLYTYSVQHYANDLVPVYNIERKYGVIGHAQITGYGPYEDRQECVFHKYIITYGTHPCVYIGLPSRFITLTDIEQIRCHGGITYSDSHLPTRIIGTVANNNLLYKWILQDKFVIGFDYSHHMDYRPDLAEHIHGLKYTAVDLHVEGFRVVEQLCDIYYSKFDT